MGTSTGFVSALAVVVLASPAQAQIRLFDIPRGSMKAALDAFVRQSGRQVIYRLDDVREEQSQGVHGSFTEEAALRQLLRGSGLSPRIDSSGAIAIVPYSGAGAPGGEAAEFAADGAAIQTGVAGQGNDPIVVTGSRIRRPNLESVVPITTVSGEEFFQTGQTAIGELLNDLPSLRSTISQSNSTRLGGGGAGLNMLDLRGLGIGRTLVLQNGRRHIPGGPFTTAVDVNTVPMDLIERVDIVTGGNSAIYGSDAIAGVVNFVLKRDYEGVQVRGQAGISKHGDAGQQYVSAIAGTNFANGRGNVAVNVDFTHQDDWYASDRPAYKNFAFYFDVDVDEPGLPNGSDGIPDAALVEDLRYLDFSNGGLFIDDVNLRPDGNIDTYLFQPDGTLVLQNGPRVGLPPFAFYSGGNGDNLQEGKLYGFAPDVQRYGFNLVSHFTVSDAFEPFIEAKYIRTDAKGGSVGSFFGGTGLRRDTYRTDNPFLGPQARNLIRSNLGLADGEEGEFFFRRNYLELGAVAQNVRRNTHRVVAGARGQFNGDWNYETSLNLAKVTSRNQTGGNVNVQRYLLAVDAVRDPVSGEIVCRAQIDPSAALPFFGAKDLEYALAQLPQDVAACVPLNPFGEGNISDAARDYLRAEGTTRSKITQSVLSAFMSGDTSEWFELPGGPIGFALGGEYRRETFKEVQDEILEAGVTHLTPAPPFEPPAFAVKELFGEVRVPLLRNRPLFEELTLSGAGRLADYRGSTGTVFAWNAGAEWAPTRDVRLRVNQSRAVRAPNLVEVHQPVGQNFTINGGPTDDPCSVQNIGAGSANREANCRAAGVPEGFEIFYSTSFEFRAGGNPNLHQEASDSFTLGAIVQPRMIPGLSLSADYYDIEVKDVITSPGVQSILNSCYDASSIDNQFCGLFERNPGPGLGPNGEEPGQIIDGSLLLAPVNYAALKVRGIDFEAAYRRNVTGIGSFNSRFIYTLALQNDQFLNPEDPGRKDQNLLELGNPKHAFNWDASVKRGPLTFGYQLQYFSKMAIKQVEDIRSVQGRAPENADAFSDRYFKGATYHNARVAYDVSRRFNVYVGVDNITNRLPPLTVDGIDDEGSIYDNVGRFFYAGAVAKF